MKNDFKVLIIGYVWPEPKSSAAGTRMMQLIRLFLDQQWKVVFATPATESEHRFDLESIGVETTNIVLNDDSFDDFVKDLNPNIVMYDRFMMEEQFGWRVSEQCPDALRILDTEDLHFLRQARQLAYKQNKEIQEGNLFGDLAKREIASIFRCDLSLIISEYEMELLQNVFKVDPKILYYLPIWVETFSEEKISKWTKFEDRKDFVFIGNFLHEPNWNSVQYLKESIWPLIRKQLPEADLKIYGAYPSQKVFQLHNPKQGFHVMGRAEDALEVIAQARALLAPLRFGAGIKGKFIEAMLCGTPSLTTTNGAESMRGDLPWAGHVTNEAEELVNEAVKIYLDKNHWSEKQQNGISIIENRFLKNNFDTDFIKRIIQLLVDMENHRQGNFIGAILNHHTMQSTKYMSRWIIEKNKSN